MAEDKVETKDKPRFPDNIPVVPPPKGARPAYDAYEGKYTRKSDGEPYALAIVEDDPLGRTHKAINNVHSWEGTEAEFKAAFVEST